MNKALHANPPLPKPKTVLLRDLQKLLPVVILLERAMAQ